MGEATGGEESSPSALSLFRFHLSPFPPETPDTQASTQSTTNNDQFSVNTQDLWSYLIKQNSHKEHNSRR